MKKISLIIALLISISVSGISYAQFTDTQKDSLTFMYSQQMIDGYPDGTFKPQSTINRAELLKMVMKTAQIEPNSSNNDCFNDVKGNDWYVLYVCFAKEKGWINGYSDGSFKPSNSVNKAEALKIISNILGLDSTKLSEPVLHNYLDVKNGSWFYPYVAVLSQSYYIDWTKNLYPNQLITRGQVAEIIFRNILATKLYPPLAPQELFLNRISDAKKLSEAESLALAARDFFRVPPLIKNLTYDQSVKAQQAVLDLYKQVKVTYADSTLNFEEWNYNVMLESRGYTYGVLPIFDEQREMQTNWRDSYFTWAVVKFDTSHKLVAYDFFTRRVDRPSLAPNITAINNDFVEITLGQEGPDPTYMIKNGEKLNFKLTNFR